MIVENIQILCEKRGISIAELERRCGLSKSSISKWDKSSPSVNNLQKVAKFFKVSITKFLKPIEKEGEHANEA